MMHRIRIYLILIFLILFLTPAVFASVAMNGGTITITDDAVLSIGSSQAWTLSMWVKPGGASASFRTLYTWRSGTGSADAALRLGIQNNVTWPPDCLYTHFPTNATAHVDDKKAYTGRETGWCRVTMSRGDDLKIRLYSYEQGGSEILACTSTNTYTQALNATGNLILGSSTFNGKLAEVAFWKRELSSAERAALDAGGLPSAASGGAPDWNLPLFDNYSVETDNLTVSDTSTTSLDGPDHPIDRGDTAPFAVTMVWPTTGKTVNYKTRIMWTKTPADTTQEQTFDVYIGKTSPPSTQIADGTSNLYCDTDVLDENSTYYVRVDAISGGGTTAGAIQQFSTFDFPTHTYFATPDGTGDGSTPAAAMGYDDIGDTESDAAIILLNPDTTIFYEYESINPTPYTEWPDRAYYSQTVIEFGITRTFADYRRIGRFLDGGYWGVGASDSLVVASYDPPRALNGLGRVMNGMMVGPTLSGSGLDEQNIGTSSSIWRAAADRGDELPLVITTARPVAILNCISHTSADNTTVRNITWYTMKTMSVFTVLDTPIANNTWFRPSYRWYSGNSVKFQWSDVITDRLPQVALGQTTPLMRGATIRSLSTGYGSSLEAIVARPCVELISGWVNNRNAAWENAAAYGAMWSNENSWAYEACMDSDVGTLEAKKRLIIGCIQRGIDLFGIYKQFEAGYITNKWYESDGACNMGRYHPILFAGALLDDAEMLALGYTTSQHIDNNWTLSNGFPFHETAFTARLTSDFLGRGTPFWPTPPWAVRYTTALDVSGTCSVTKDSKTVTGEVGDTWTTAMNGHKFMTTYMDGTTRKALDEVRGISTTKRPYTIASVTAGSPPTLTLTEAYEGETNGSAGVCIATYMTMGNQYKAGESDYSEFDASWDNVCWAFQKPMIEPSSSYPSPHGGWAMNGSVFGEDTYTKDSTAAMLGWALVAAIMNENEGYPIVAAWNSPQFFEYMNWCIENVPSNGWGFYSNGHAVVISSTQWSWPLTEWSPAETVTKATTPIPGEDAVAVAIDQILSWTSGANATSHNVYFGTVSESLDLVSPGQLGTTYTPVMTYSTTYYWRVDELGGDEQEITGDEWSFTTRAAPVLKKIGLRKSE